jgi:ribosome recycling factor
MPNKEAKQRKRLKRQMTQKIKQYKAQLRRARKEAKLENAAS